MGQSILNQFATSMQGLAVPLAIIGIVFIGVAMALTPIARNWSAEARDGLKYVIGGLILLTFAPAIVSFFLTTFGAGGN